jgi:iron-sulfur cluster assembly protein
MIVLTDKAVSELKRIIDDKDGTSEDMYLRVSIEGGGCSGFQYNLGFIDKKGYDENKDSKYEQDGITIVVDRKSSLYIDGTTLDWYDDLTQKGFKFDNPNAQKTCGCGSSFSA